MTSRRYMISPGLLTLLLCSWTQVSTAECPVNFEDVDFSPFIGVCTASNVTSAYPVEACCSSLDSLMCPYAELLNDASSDCSISFFTYLSIASGTDESDVYAELCSDSDGQLGLTCQAAAPSPG